MTPSLYAAPANCVGVVMLWVQGGVLMQSLPIILMLIGCEPVTPSGNPLEPATVAPSASQPAAIPTEHDVADEAKETADQEDEGTFTISSEELNQLANGELPTKEEPVAEEPEETADAGDAPDAADAPPVAKTEPTSSGWSQAVGKAWPVRLVTTVPNASPPRAILGLPNGKEIVVNPGSMVPDMGLVVVAISPNSAEIARIAPAGDHATIESMTLRAQY